MGTDRMAGGVYAVQYVVLILSTPNVPVSSSRDLGMHYPGPVDSQCGICPQRATAGSQPSIPVFSPTHPKYNSECAHLPGK